FNMITYNPFCPFRIPDEIKFNLIMVVERKVKLRLGPVEISKAVRLCQRCDLPQYIVMHGHDSESYSVQRYESYGKIIHYLPARLVGPNSHVIIQMKVYL